MRLNDGGEYVIGVGITEFAQNLRIMLLEALNTNMRSAFHVTVRDAISQD